MAYFPNGTAGEAYEAQYCNRCANEDDKRGCAVWLAHLLYSYEECNAKSNAKHMLDLLIPVRADGYPGQCAMFRERAGTRRAKRRLPLLERMK